MGPVPLPWPPAEAPEGPGSPVLQATFPHTPCHHHLSSQAPVSPPAGKYTNPLQGLVKQHGFFYFLRLNCEGGRRTAPLALARFCVCAGGDRHRSETATSQKLQQGLESLSNKSWDSHDLRL